VKIKIVYRGFHLEVTLFKKNQCSSSTCSKKITLTIKCVFYDQNMTARLLPGQKYFFLIVKYIFFDTLGFLSQIETVETRKKNIVEFVAYYDF